MPPGACAIAFALALAGPAAAGTTACWIDRGVVVVPAMVGGVAGDYILDTGTPGTMLAETQAQGAGYADTALGVDVRLAGLTLSRRAVRVQDLDARTREFPTPIAGVIGADILPGHVLSVSFAPCRVTLREGGGRPPRGTTLPLRLAGGVPTVAAAVSDGPQARAGRFVLATGSELAVRLDDRLAGAPGAGHPERLRPYGPGRARLRALSFAGTLQEEVAAGLIGHTDLPDQTLGVIGAPALAGWTVSFDVDHRRLTLSPARGDKRKGPRSPGALRRSR